MLDTSLTSTTILRGLDPQRCLGLPSVLRRPVLESRPVSDPTPSSAAVSLARKPIQRQGFQSILIQDLDSIYLWIL